MEIELYCLVDSVGRMYYTGFQESILLDYQKEQKQLPPTQIIKLTGYMPEGK